MYLGLITALVLWASAFLLRSFPDWLYWEKSMEELRRIDKEKSASMAFRVLFFTGLVNGIGYTWLRLGGYPVAGSLFGSGLGDSCGRVDAARPEFFALRL